MARRRGRRLLPARAIEWLLVSSTVLLGCTLLRSWDDLSDGGEADAASPDAGADGADADTPDAPDGEAGPFGNAIHWNSSCAIGADIDTKALDFGDGEAFTVELWFKQPEESDGGNVLMQNGGTNLMLPGWAVELGSNRSFEFYAREGDGGATAICPDHPLLLDHAYHLAVVRQGDTAVRFVRDATVGEKTHTALASCTGVPSAWDSTTPFSLGSSVDSDDGGCRHTVEGIMDEVRIWNVARTKSQLDENADKPVTCGTEGLLAYWTLDAVAGTFIENRCDAGALRLEVTGTDLEPIPSPFDDVPPE